MTTTRVPPTSEYFHGDARFANSQIDVVRSNRVLWDRIETPSNEPLGHLAFVAGSRYVGGGGFGGCYLQTMFKSLLDATDGRVGSRRELAALFWRIPRISYFVGLRESPYGQPEKYQMIGQSLSADADRIRYAQEAIPGIVTTTKVFKIDRDNLGHEVSVYDFETADTMYLMGNGIIGSNCYCDNTEVMPE